MIVKCVKSKLRGGEDIRYVTIMLDLSSYYPGMKSARINSRKFLIKVTCAFADWHCLSLNTRVLGISSPCMYVTHTEQNKSLLTKKL